MRNILSIQSHVAYGHVGNASATFPMQLLGCEVWPIHTVQFSNHTGYGQWRGQVFGAEHIRDVVEGVAERGVLPSCDGALSGYMGDASIGEAILDAVARVRAANPKALYCCDPVMGDVGRGFFVRPGIPEFMKERAVPAADAITPNQFELEYLAGRPVETLAHALEAAAIVRRMGPRVVLVTSFEDADAPEGAIGMLATTDDGAWLVRTPRLPLSPAPNGAGDCVAALFLVHLLKDGDAAAALEETAAAIYAVFEATHAAGARELQLVAAQDEIKRPSRRFACERVA